MRKIYLLGAFFVAAIVAACTTTGGAPPTAPTVQIIAPPFGATFVEGQEVGIQSVSTDPSGVTRVELYIDGQLVKTDPVPSQGQTQFNVVQVWQAQGVGAHTVLVRAFNTANAPGEASIPIAVSALVPVVPTATVAAPTETVIPVGVTFTLIPATDTPTVQANTPAPTTPPPPTPIPPTPVPPTIPPLVFLPPFDGGMDVFLSWNNNELQLGAFANDTVVGGDNGDGIAYIDFFIQDLAGNVIATKRENNRPYCFFGEAGDDCTPSKPGDANFQWGPNKPIQTGWYLIRAVGHTPDNRIQVAERPLYVNLGSAPAQTLFATLSEPFDFNIEDALPIAASANGPSAGSGIERIDFVIADYNGRIVHKRTEQFADYCGFGGGENNQPCNIYNFKQNGGKWPNGDPIALTQYIVRAIAYARDGAIGATTFFFQIDRVQ